MRREFAVDAGSGPSEHFQLVYEAFQRAELAAGTFVFSYNLGGFTINLRFAGAALVHKITPALTHRAIEPVRTPDLNICLWDTASTGTGLPAPSWGADAYGAQGMIKGFNDARHHTHVSLDGPNLRFAALNMLDQQLNTALFWLSDVSEFPYHERSAPLRMLLNWWMSQRGRHVIHSGAVGDARGGVLLAGKSGSGKSTTALACLSSNLFYVSDDYCLIGGEAMPHAFSLYNSGKLHGDNLHRLPHLSSLITNRANLAKEKAIIFLNECFRDKLIESVPIRAILLPRVTNLPATTVKNISKAKALTALAPSSIFQLPGTAGKAFHFLSRLVQQVPSYELALGTNTSHIPDAIRNLLSGMDA